MQLELNLMRGLRLLLLCALMFGLVIYAANIELRSAQRLGLLNTYTTIFALNPDDLAAMKTPDAFFDYLKQLSEQSRLLQPLSSQYFIEETGEMKVMVGVRKFLEEEIVEIEGLEPAIDSAAFSLTAWIKLTPEGGANVIRKPLGRGAEKPFSCWGWFVGSPVDRFDFGAHDFRGGEFEASMQESISGDSTIAADGKWHFVAIVVNQTTLSFFTDAQLQKEVVLQRPVTDCSGRALIIGAPDIPRLGEITFFPRQVSVTEMQEISQQGFTFEALAWGKLPFQPEKTPFDTANSIQQTYFSEAKTERKKSTQEMHLENSFNRMEIAALAIPPIDAYKDLSARARIAVPAIPNCKTVPIFGSTTSCSIMTGTAVEKSPQTGNKTYMNMIPPAYRPAGLGGRDQLLLDHNKPKQYLSYDSVEFPHFCGKSATFSMWIENWDDGARSTLISRYVNGTSKRNKGAWFYQIDADPSGGTKCCIGQIPAEDKVAFWKCTVLAPSLNKMLPNTRRHLALVLNKDDNTIKFYIDGVLAETKSSEEPSIEAWIRDERGGGVGRLDCLMDTPYAYTGLGHRVPGESPYMGPVQDWRYYVGHALTDAEIQNIAQLSLDEKGIMLRKCTLVEEGRDSNWKDMYGNDCAWYQENNAAFPAICSSAAVKRECPVACGTYPPCMNAESTRPTHTIWARQTPIREYDMALGTNGDSICVREGLDVVAQCREQENNPHNGVLCAAGQNPPGGSFCFTGNTDYTERDYLDAKKTQRIGNGRWCNSPPAPEDGGPCSNLKVWDCAVLEVAVNPACSFRVDTDANNLPWTRTINSEIKAAGGYTVRFWWKAQDETSWDSINKGQMVAYSSFVPPRILFALDFYGNGEKINYWLEAYDTCNLSLENLNNIDGGEAFEPGKWYFVAVVVGSPLATGGRSLFVMSGSQPGTMVTMKKNWCSYMPEPLEFLQGFTMPGGLVTSPIEVTGKPMTVKELQKSFYSLKPMYRLRRGPTVLDEDRTSFEVDYQTPAAGYPYQVSLVSPPLLLQTRVERTEKCSYALGNEVHRKVWDNAVNVTCLTPYSCTQGIKDNPTELIACSSKESPAVFFGRTPHFFKGNYAFCDFLQSIADAELVLREGEPKVSRTFLDPQTRTMSCLMVTYSAHFGICSTIEITATFASDVNVDFTVRHFQSVEGEDLAAYTKLTICALVLAVIIFVEKIVTARSLEWADIWQGMIVDMLVQVVLPILYFGFRLMNILKSGEAIRRVVGVNGLAGLPWESRDLELGTKIQNFLEQLTELESLNDREDAMSIFYFVLSAVQLLRLICQTAAHPRTAMLINTLCEGIDDLWHFCLLLLIVLVGFIMLGTAQFASERAEFATSFKAFEMLWEMLLGSMPASGVIPSTFWTNDKLLMIYLMLYNFLCFMFMFNFIIAIICESYLTVTHEIKMSDAEQEFFYDMFSVSVVTCKSFAWRWPPHLQMLETLQILKKKRVSLVEMRILFPGMSPLTLASIFDHYRSFEHIRRACRPAPTEFSAAMRQMMQQLSVMLGVPLPSMVQYLEESKKIQEKGFIQHLVDDARKGHQLEIIVKQQDQTIKMLKKVLQLHCCVVDEEETVNTDSFDALQAIKHLGPKREGTSLTLAAATASLKPRADIQTGAAANVQGRKKPLTGIFQQRGILNTAFKNRFFVLNENTISYFASQKDYEKQLKPKGVFELCEDDEVKPYCVDDQDKNDPFRQKSYHFTVTKSTGKELKCRTYSEELRDIWVSSIDAAIRGCAPGLLALPGPSVRFALPTAQDSNGSPVRGPLSAVPVPTVLSPAATTVAMQQELDMLEEQRDIWISATGGERLRDAFPLPKEDTKAGKSILPSQLQCQTKSIPVPEATEASLIFFPDPRPKTHGLPLPQEDALVLDSETPTPAA